MWEPSGGEDFLVCVREDKTELNAHVHFCTIYIFIWMCLGMTSDFLLPSPCCVADDTAFALPQVNQQVENC